MLKFEADYYLKLWLLDYKLHDSDVFSLPHLCKFVSLCYVDYGQIVIDDGEITDDYTNN